MEPGTFRAIEYQIRPLLEVTNKGSIGAQARTLLPQTDVAVLKCVDAAGKKLTVFAEAEEFRCLLASGEARDPKGMRMAKGRFPLVLPGWLDAN